MQELRNALGRFVGGLSDVEEWRSTFREFLQQHPEQRGAVARWLQDAIRQGRLAPGILMTVDDLVQVAPDGPAVVAPDKDRTGVRATPVAPTVEDEVSLHEGSVLDQRYTLVTELGRGGMGTVFKTRDRNREMFQDRHHPFIALKVLSDEFKRHPDARMALQRETVRAQSLAHPNVVTVYDFDYDGPHAYMTMELLEGQPLDEWLQGEEFHDAPLEKRWSIVNGVGAGLAYAHAQGVVHSDLKPGNIFMCRSGVVKVMDFGIARPLSNVPGQPSTTLFDPAERLGGLTPAYASLEQWNHEPPDPRDDVYAFACVVYAVFSGGQHPYGRASAKAAFESLLVPRRIESLTRRQWDVLRRGLALQRSDRIASIDEFLHQFEPQTWLQKHRLQLLAVGGAILVIALLLGARAYRVYVEDTAAFLEDDALNQRLWPEPAALAKPLSQEQQRDVDDLLYLGQEALKQASATQSLDDLSAILSKGDNNLHDLLKSIRSVDPGNSQAVKLTHDAAELCAARARPLLKANRLADAYRLVLEGQAFQHTRDLFQLKQQICRRNPAVCTRN